MRSILTRVLIVCAIAVASILAAMYPFRGRSDARHAHEDEGRAPWLSPPGRVVAPATANLLSKFAAGHADDLVSTLFLQAECPVLLAPAMSALMWSKPAVQRNVGQLRQDGCHFVGPASGWLSCRVSGEGRMSEPDEILEAAEALLNR